jgi:hypothetical protein
MLRCVLCELNPGLWVEQFSKASRSDTADAEFAARCLMAHHSDTCFGFKLDGHYVSFASVRFSARPRKNAWGRYVDWHVVYTPVDLRRKHYATQLWLAIKERAISEGYDRVKSVAKGKLGYYLHRSLGHQFWGWDKGGRGLVVDSPLTNAEFPTGVPIEARCTEEAHLMSLAELVVAEGVLL